VKHRQWFRPVAPLVRLDELHLLTEASTRAQPSQLFCARGNALGPLLDVASSAIAAVLRNASALLRPDRIGFNGLWLPPLAEVLTAHCGLTAAAGSASPFMSFAPTLSADARARFPAAAHLDHTARIQVRYC
jgi:predicted NodU family carbamoyl transferase